jgi:hypothetical protein
MNILKVTMVAAIGLAATGLSLGNAQAMPIGGLSAGTTDISDGLQSVRWVCGPFRCWWRPDVYYAAPRYRYWEPRPFAYRWGRRRW